MYKKDVNFGKSLLTYRQPMISYCLKLFSVLVFVMCAVSIKNLGKSYASVVLIVLVVACWVIAAVINGREKQRVADNNEKYLRSIDEARENLWK